MAQLTVIQADCVEYLKTLDDNTFDSVVTDPPYALDFMGKSWDSFGGGKGFQAWCESWAAECLRVLKPGGYLLSFGGTGTTAEACHLEGFDCMLIENDPDSIKRTNVRMEKYSVQSEAVWIQPSLWGLELWPHG
jgi:DNA modification methylase